MYNIAWMRISRPYIDVRGTQLVQPFWIYCILLNRARKEEEEATFWRLNGSNRLLEHRTEQKTDDCKKLSDLALNQILIILAWLKALIRWHKFGIINFCISAYRQFVKILVRLKKNQNYRFKTVSKHNINLQKV